MLSVDTRGGAIALFVVALLLLGKSARPTCIEYCWIESCHCSFLGSWPGSHAPPRIALWPSNLSPLRSLCRHMGSTAEPGRAQGQAHCTHMDGLQHWLLCRFSRLRTVRPYSLLHTLVQTLNPFASPLHSHCAYLHMRLWHVSKCD